MPELVYPPNPVYQEPPAPSRLSAAFGGKRKRQEAVERAGAERAAAVHGWQHHRTVKDNAYLAEQAKHDQVEAVRVEKLAQADAA